jgi:hypothetical protein
MPTSDLERFCRALQRQQEHLLEAARSSRLRPPTDLTTAELNLPAQDGYSGAAIAAEILDLSGDRMKIAVSPGPELRAGQIILLRFQAFSGEGYQLQGAVRWLEASSLILVFGIELLAAASLAPEVFAGA